MPDRILKYWNLHKVSILLAFLSAAFYFTFAYHLERTDFVKLLGLFAALFVLCFKLVQFEKWNFKFLLGVGILFRLAFLLAEPNLSQDFYRFIWDGELVSHFINPYLNVPNTLIEQPDLIIANAQELYNGMGSLSAKHFSNYPPLNQLMFALAALLGGKSILGSVIVMRGIIILADIGIFYFGRKLLKNINQSPHLIFWYFLNPLVIIELTGNLHFEGVMLFFFVWALYLLSIHKWQWAAVVYACSISVKLVPLLFLPLFLKHFKFDRAIAFYAIIGVTSLLLFAPFYSSEFVHNYSQTIGLWFSNFEFNASLWNVVKKIGVQFDAKPWELIKTYGKITPILTIVIVLLYTFLRKNQKLSVLLTSMLWVLTLYYFMSATVHPWYVIFLLVLTGFSKYRFPIIWSAAIVLSYFAYSLTDFKENLWLLAIEYLAVLTFLIYELVAYRNKT
ncbi:mannosyltransferase [Maribacter algarum]|uniref:Mannosyltransferase n=1 Tax=Maribacter algarum (ex Zhang et al. 2020) TaxID=2578118 RepID=A0A5S3PX06_9FLAO|nr:mannosyltransferase [Maribacter algarum]TMM59448.1 mannosyltransferase [Maribacter algarum]